MFYQKLKPSSATHSKVSFLIKHSSSLFNYYRTTSTIPAVIVLKYKICANSFLTKAIVNWDSLDETEKKKSKSSVFVHGVKRKLLAKY